MPVYFSNVAPTCPISLDQPAPPNKPYNFGRLQKNVPTVPRPIDLPSALIVADRLRQILLSIVNNPIRNNVIPGKQGKDKISPDKYKLKTARWVEQKSKRVKRKYKYYGVDGDGQEDKATWVIMERIERMVWYDKAWKSYLIWEYGDKGEGEAIGQPSSGGGGDAVGGE
jgi:hypothetical protein